jgi:DNA-binding CsgD family transcriptional regulator
MIDPAPASILSVPGGSPSSADPAILSAVVADIYDAAIDPQRWPSALEAICRFVGASQGLIYWHDATQGEVDTLFSFNDDPVYRRLYEESYAPLNPLFPAMTFRPVGFVFEASDVVPDEEMQQTRFFREWLAPQAMTGSLGLVLEKDATRAAFMTVQWQGGRRIDDDARSCMGLLAPHLSRAVAIGRLFVRHRSREAALIGTLDHVEASVFLLSEAGRIVLANAQGRRMIETGHVLRECGGRLRAASTTADRAIVENLRTIERSGTEAMAADWAIPLTEAAEGGWTASLLPLVDGARRRDGEAHEAIAVLFVRSMSKPGIRPLEALAKEHGLTASEIRTVEATLRLSGLDTIAEALGVSPTTVKTHLKHVYCKTGTRNQAELIRLVAGFAV